MTHTSVAKGPHGTFTIAGEGPYCNWCGQNTKAQAERDALKELNGELVGALKLLRSDHSKIEPHHEDLCAICKTADAVLARAKQQPAELLLLLLAEVIIAVVGRR